ncbi:MAG: MFS transporter [Deltaproteobacteria bacterium]|nr:MFS transporter [Deltaproteobacteria bacterium]
MTRPRTSEISIALWGGVTFAALLASFTMFRPVRDALVLDGNPDDIPWLFTATFAAALVASPLWSRILSRRPKRRVVPIAFHVFALCLAVFASLVATAVEPVIVGRVFYVWSSVFNIFVVSVFWSLLTDLLGPSTARRLYGPIAAGGTIGTIVGPLLTRLLVSVIDVPGVLVMSAVLLELAVIGAWRVKLAGEALEHAAEDTPAHADASTGLRRVARSGYLLAIVGYVLCTATAATFLYLEQAAIVKEAFTDRVARTEFFASLDLWIAGVTLVVQTVLAGPLLAWLGPGLVLCLLPLSQGIGISMLAATPSIAVLATVQVISRALTHGLTRPARELLFTVVDREDKYHAKNAIDIVGYRFGDFGSSWLHNGLVALSAGTAALAVAAVPLAAVWIGLAVVLGKGFRERVAAS